MLTLKQDYNRRKEMTLALKKEQMKTLDGLSRLNHLYKLNLFATGARFEFLKIQHNKYLKYNVLQDEFYIDLSTCFDFLLATLENGAYCWRQAHNMITQALDLVAQETDEREMSLNAQFYIEPSQID